MKLIITLTLLFITAIHPTVSLAAPYSVEKLPDETVYNDFVVGPGKYQVEIKPGESKVVNMIVSNRLGTEKAFQIQTEDFVGSRNTQATVMLLGSERGPYSLKDYLSFASTTFTIGHSERITIPVTVSIPTDAQPGGLYGSVVISTVTSPQDQVLEGQSSAGVSPIVTRIGSLFFIRVTGDVKEELTLEKFSLKNDAKFLGSGPVNFEILYENNGTVHQNPYGSISIKNIFGSEVGQVDIEPWFILPDSLRLREVSWKSPFLFGRYEATVDIVTGIEDKEDSASVVFWVIPWKIIALAFIGLIVLIALIRWLASKISITVKK
jgi:hypothetical protein